jgi:ubiquinone/menaquinone biosynthesis C-methylase UbiE
VARKVEKPDQEVCLMDVFDRDYFENGIITRKSNYQDYSWSRLGTYFTATAKHITGMFKPKKLLDAGTAKGFLVYALCQAGVDAYGVDISKYAVENAIPEVKDRVRLGTIQKLDYPANSFDVVTAFDVLEHIKEEEIPQVCAELLRVSRKWVVVRVPTRKDPGDLDTYHETVKPKQWWEKQFAAAGWKVVPCDPYVNRGVWWFNIPEYLIVVEKAKKHKKKVV